MAGPLYDMATVYGSKKWGHWRLTMLRFRQAVLNGIPGKDKQDKKLPRRGLGLGVGLNLFAILWQVCIALLLLYTGMSKIFQGPPDR
ncbi:uncharacterized protein RHO25_003034 [Cercospora beticola]|uniref:Uncharacterized protein n=1 Tax=Cercospora beticola TaxID=122368 RepID=A0ABZ0NFX1_CERBT|nr:hypothetical protein RHO25_003034 [Cercospora beticola]